MSISMPHRPSSDLAATSNPQTCQPLREIGLEFELILASGSIEHLADYRFEGNRTLPAVGASTCASGSHVWKGKTGTLISNPAESISSRVICV